MASTGTVADDSQATSETPPQQMATSNNDLCGLCLLALTINDQAAGGTARTNISNGMTTLDLSGFTYNDWQSSYRSNCREERRSDEPRIEKGDSPGWVLHGWGNFNDDKRYRTTQVRYLCAGNKHERLVTLPTMLEISASAPCRLCSTLRSLFIEQYAESFWWNEDGSTLRFTIQYEWCEYRSFFDDEYAPGIPPSSQSLSGMAVLVYRPGQEPNRRDVYQFDVVAWPGPCQEWLKIKSPPLDPDGPMSDQNVAFMKQRIERCISDHPMCEKKTSTTNFIPRRLLDLGDHSSNSARLIECHQTLSLTHPETQLQYATLSYCWGKSLTMMTTTANKLGHETTGIDVHNMPATFQDAIHVAKKLGIRYIWIDALCIVQDDKDDWEAEAIKMCDIFAHSQVTICAAKSSSSSEHFLQRLIDETLTVQFHSVLNPDILGHYSIRLEPRHAEPAEYDLERSKWVSRAWVWQEETMSTRKLVFGNKSFQFRCSTGNYFENRRSEGRHEMAFHPSIYHWTSAIATYSSRALTYPSDRLKAIAGAAKFIESSQRVEGQPRKYLVGLWQDYEFETHIRWVCQKPSLTRKEMMKVFRDEKQYIAPSWSWASRNEGVECLCNGTEPAFRVINSDLRASHKSAMVSVAFGSSITLSGKIRQTPVEPSSGRLVTDSERWPYRWEAPNVYGETDFWLDWVPEEDDAEESEYQRRLCLLLTTEIGNPDFTAAGLIITPFLAPGTGDMFYYRVGAFIHRGDMQLFASAEEKEVTIR